MKRIAQAVSLVLDPRVEVPVLLALAVWTQYQNGAPLLFLSLLLFVDAILPLVFYIHLRQKGEISDWDIRKRHQRVPLYAFTTVAHLGGVGVAWVFGQIALAETLAIFWFLALIFTLVTMMWKVSIHAGVNGALVTYLAVISQGRLSWLYLLVGLVAWSRVRLMRHGWEQVLVGGLLGALGVLAGMRVVGL